MTNGQMVLSKTFSARWIMAVMFSLTACWGFLIGKLPAEAFMALVGAAVTAYFSKGPVDAPIPTVTTTTIKGESNETKP